ncbi:hypothetical protein [Shewanella sp. ENK2]|uniref:hypothetical protein n=1 Tax=Shewanella sp. ENK2 TaxID=2775245 RepID=UPI003749EE99
MFVESFLDYFNKEDAVFLLNEIHSKFISKDHRSFNYPLKDRTCSSSMARLFNREVVKTLFFILLLPYILFTGRTIVLLGTSNFQSFFFSFLRYIPLIKIRIVFHSQLESLVKEKNERRRFGNLFINAINRMENSKNIKVLVLGKHIKSKLQLLGYTNVCSIPHPIPRSSFCSENKLPTDIPKKTHNIAMVGLIRDDSKNCNSVYDLEHSESTKVHVIGRAKNDFKIDYSTSISFQLWDRIYTELEFSRAIENIHSFIYFLGKKITN